MGSLTERNKLAAQLVLLFRKLPSEAQRLDWTAEELWEHERKVLEKLVELHVNQILTAILANFRSAGLCGIYVRIAQSPPYHVVWLQRENPEILYRAIRRAIGSLATSGKQFHEYINVCVAQAIAEETLELIEELRQHTAGDLLKLCDAATLERMTFVIELLSKTQRNALRRLLFRKLDGKAQLLLIDRELNIPEQPTPKQRYTWLSWYLWRLEMHKPEMQRALGGVPRVLAVADGDRMLTNRKTGQPADPLGAIHAPVWRELGRALNRKGHPIKDPESESRLARSIGVSREKLRNYPELPIQITPDGKGAVNYKYTGDDLLKAIEASLRKKPGGPAST